MSKRHPRVRYGRDLALEALRREEHVPVRSSGIGAAIVDKVLAREGIERRVVLRLPSFLGVARIVAQTGLLAIMPHTMPPPWATARTCACCRRRSNCRVSSQAALA